MRWGLQTLPLSHQRYGITLPCLLRLAFTKRVISVNLLQCRDLMGRWKAEVDKLEHLMAKARKLD